MSAQFRWKEREGSALSLSIPPSLSSPGARIRRLIQTVGFSARGASGVGPCLGLEVRLVRELNILKTVYVILYLIQFFIYYCHHFLYCIFHAIPSFQCRLCHSAVSLFHNFLSDFFRESLTCFYYRFPVLRGLLSVQKTKLYNVQIIIQFLRVHVLCKCSALGWESGSPRERPPFLPPPPDRISREPGSDYRP